ncbi:MAG: universal stress protein [Roseiarcus sp.]|jgi:nucleotide-binding universal stress UspA family protein
MKRILVGYDGSASAEKAFSLGLDLAEKYAAEVHVLAVARPPEFGGDVETEAEIENLEQRCLEILKPLQATAALKKTGAVDFEVAVGHPAEQIVRHAESWNADLVIVGHRGHTFIERWLTGSVAKRVMDHAPCAVLVAR